MKKMGEILGVLSVPKNLEQETGNCFFCLKRKTTNLKLLLLAVFLFAALPSWAAIDKGSIKPKLAKVHMPFIENQGQIKDASVKFYANTFAGTVFLTENGEIVYSLQSADKNHRPKNGKMSIADLKNRDSKHTKGWVIKERIEGFSNLSIRGVEKAVASVNYFKGNNTEGWRSNIPSYAMVSLGEIYDGIELKLKAHGNNIEKIFIVNPRADVSKIAISQAGAESVRINASGALEMVTGLGTVTFTRPHAYQEIGGKRVEVNVDYALRNTEAGSEPVYGFEVVSYSKDYPLIIDPLLASTFIGGAYDDLGSSIAVDSVGGYVYITGWTNSLDYPATPGAYSTAYNAGFDVFVSKLSADLSALLASTYIGGSYDDYGTSIALDRWGSNVDDVYVYVTGRTISPDYPTTPGAYDTTWNGGFDVFVTKLNANLTNLVASTYIGGSLDTSMLPGSGDDGAHDIAIDRWGCSIHDVHIYITGWTDSINYPATTDLPGAGAYDTAYNGGFIDVIVSKLNDNLSSLLASTYIGGHEDDMGNSIALDRWGSNRNDVNVYVAGETDSPNYPVTAGAYDITCGTDGNCNFGYYDVFVSRLDANLSNTPNNYIGTFIGGSNDDGGLSIALDRWESNVNVYVTGETDSSDYPTTPGAYDVTYNGGFDVFVSKLNANLSNLIASTFIGGSNNDWGSSIARDAGPRRIDKFCGEYIYVTGWTNSPNYPATAGAYDTACGTDGNCNFDGSNYYDDAFVSKLDTTLGSLIDSTFIGGSADDRGNSIAISFAGNVYITGQTVSPDYPATPGAYDISYNGNWDAFVSEFACYFGTTRGRVSFQTVLGPDAASGWQIDGVGDPFILKENGTYKMWYAGFYYVWAAPYWQLNAKIGYAESVDGVIWTNRQLVHKDPNNPDYPGSSYYYTNSPWVIKEGSTYRMWHVHRYEVAIPFDWSDYISHMTSTDGIGWNNDDQKVLGYSANYYNARKPTVIREADGTYSMWHHFVQHPGSGVAGPSDIFRAKSNDGISWTNEQLVLPGIAGGPEDSVLNPDVVKETGGIYTMYYVASNDIYRASSADGIIWNNRQRILTSSQLSNNISGLDSPHYFKDTDGTEYLYFQFSRAEAGSTTGYRQYIGRVRLSDIVDISGLDFGDAPDPTYPSRLASNGARHSSLTPNFYFGMGIDYEADSRQVDADIPFDDGLISRNPITFSVTNPTRLTRCVNLLIDSNRDGDWQDAGEWVVQNFAVTTAGNYIPNPNLFLPDNTWMRMTITNIPLTNYAGSSPQAFQGGETEDFLFPAISGPDLVIAALFAPTPVGAGTAISLSDVTQNRLVGSADASTTSFYLSTDCTLDGGDTLLGSRVVPALAGNASNRATTSVTIPAGTPLGIYYIIAQADNWNVVAESNETNNTRCSSAITITGPDLVIASVFAPATARRGTAISLSDVTQNRLPGSAGASTTGVYLSTTTTGGSLIGSRAVPALAGGASSTATYSVTVPAGTTPGTWYIIWKADYLGVSGEVDNTNNTRYRAITIRQ